MEEESVAQDFLPGFESIGNMLTSAPSSMTDDEIDEKAKQRFPNITLERIKRERPDLVETVARAFFNLGLSLRDISYITGLHRNTCSEIIRERNPTDEMRKVRRKKVLQVHQLGMIAISRLYELLHDPAAVKKAGISGIMDVTRRLNEMELDLDQQAEVKTIDAPSVNIVDSLSTRSDAEQYLN